MTLWVEGPTDDLILAETFEDALRGVFPDLYDFDAPDRGRESREAQREAIAHRVATETQAFELLRLADAGVFNPDDEGEETLMALFEPRDAVALIAWKWLSPRLPLIVTSAAVALRGRSAPTGVGVTVVDSRSARTLVLSLSDLGMIRFGLL